MTEAFEIGVSLALQDGVSDAICKARRDVASLERAVRESGVSPRTLRETGVKASSVAFEAVRRAMPEQAPRVTKELNRAGSGTLSGATEHPQYAFAKREVIPGAARSRNEADETTASIVQGPKPDAWPSYLGNSAEPPPAAPRAITYAPLSQTSSPGFRAETADRSVKTPLLRASAVAPLIDATPDKEAQLPTALAATGAISVAAPRVHAEDSHGPPAELQVLTSHAQNGRETVDHLSLVSLLHLSGGTTAVPQREAQFGIVSNDPAGADDDAAISEDGVGSAYLSQAPTTFAPGVYRRGPQAAATVTAGQTQNMSQATQMRDTGPNEGDVFLDGVLVGRWISRFLNREAGRASAGPTGFDARRGQLLPGVTVGG